MSFLILHVDDDSDIRELVEISLGLEPEFKTISCANGDDALKAAADLAPDLILCDVMMPGMDGITVLTRLRECPNTAKIPVIFMTARARNDEIEKFKLLGAAAVLTKPFDPRQLANIVREYLYSRQMDAARCGFIERMHTDAALLRDCRQMMCNASDGSDYLEFFQSCVHKLSGSAGVYNFSFVSSAAAALEEEIIEMRAGRGAPGRIAANLDALLDCIAHA